MKLLLIVAALSAVALADVSQFKKHARVQQLREKQAVTSGVQGIRQGLRGIRQFNPPALPSINPSSRFRGLMGSMRNRFRAFGGRINGVRQRFVNNFQRLRSRPRPAFPSLLPVRPASPAAAAAKAVRGNRRHTKLPAVYFKKPEDIPGYTTFTLDDVILPEAEAKQDSNTNDLTFVDLTASPSDKVVQAVEAAAPVVAGNKQPVDFELRR